MQNLLRDVIVKWLVRKAVAGKPVVLSPALAREIAQLLHHV